MFGVDGGSGESVVTNSGKNHPRITRKRCITCHIGGRLQSRSSGSVAGYVATSVARPIGVAAAGTWIPGAAGAINVSKFQSAKLDSRTLCLMR